MGEYIFGACLPAKEGEENHQHAGPNEATYSTGSPTSMPTTHGQTAFLFDSLISGILSRGGGGGNANLSYSGKGASAGCPAILPPG